MTLRVVNEDFLTLFAKNNRVPIDMMQIQDDRFFSFAKRLYTNRKRKQRLNQIWKRVENHRFLEKDHLNIDCVMSSVL